MTVLRMCRDVTKEIGWPVKVSPLVASMNARAAFKIGWEVARTAERATSALTSEGVKLPSKCDARVKIMLQSSTTTWCVESVTMVY